MLQYIFFKNKLVLFFLSFILLITICPKVTFAFDEVSGIFDINEVESVTESEKIIPGFWSSVSQNDGVTINGKYSFTPKATNDTVVTYKSSNYQVGSTESSEPIEIDQQSGIDRIPFDAGLSEDSSSYNYVMATNMGAYNGIIIDVKYTVVSSASSSESHPFLIGVRTKYNYDNPYNYLFTISRADKGRPVIRIEYFNHMTGEKVPIGDGHFTFNNLDNNEWVNILPKGDQASLDNYYTSSNSVLRIPKKNQSKQNLTLVGSVKGNGNMGDTDYIGTVTFSNIDYFIIQYRTNENYSLIQAGFYELRGLRYELPKPNLYSRERPSEKEFSYILEQFVPNNQINPLNYLEMSVNFNDLPENLSILKNEVKIYDSFGNNLTSYFDIKYIEEKRITATAYNTSIKKINGTALYFEIPASLNLDAYTEEQLETDEQLNYVDDIQMFNIKNNPKGQTKYQLNLIDEMSILDAISSEYIGLIYYKGLLSVNFLTDVTSIPIVGKFEKKFFKREVNLATIDELSLKEKEAINNGYLLNLSTTPDYKKTIIVPPSGKTVNYKFRKREVTLEFDFKRRKDIVNFDKFLITGDTSDGFNFLQITIPKGGVIPNFDSLVKEKGWTSNIVVEKNKVKYSIEAQPRFDLTTLISFIQDKIDIDVQSDTLEDKIDIGVLLRTEIDGTEFKYEEKNFIPQPINYIFKSLLGEIIPYEYSLGEKEYKINDVWTLSAPEIKDYKYESGGYFPQIVTDTRASQILIYKKNRIGVTIEYLLDSETDKYEKHLPVKEGKNLNQNKPNFQLETDIGETITDFITSNKDQVNPEVPYYHNHQETGKTANYWRYSDEPVSDKNPLRPVDLEDKIPSRPITITSFYSGTASLNSVDGMDFGTHKNNLKVNEITSKKAINYSFVDTTFNKQTSLNVRFDVPMKNEKNKKMTAFMLDYKGKSINQQDVPVIKSKDTEKNIFTGDLKSDLLFKRYWLGPENFGQFSGVLVWTISRDITP